MIVKNEPIQKTYTSLFVKFNFKKEEGYYSFLLGVY